MAVSLRESGTDAVRREGLTIEGISGERTGRKDFMSAKGIRSDLCSV